MTLSRFFSTRPTASGAVQSPAVEPPLDVDPAPVLSDTARPFRGYQDGVRHERHHSTVRRYTHRSPVSTELACQGATDRGPRR